MPFIPSFNEFSAQQQCPWLYHRRDQIVFENGAVWYGTELDSGHRGEGPPEDRIGLQQVRGRFIGAKLKVQVREFKQLKNYIETQAEFHGKGVGPAPPMEALQELKQLQASVQALRDELKVILEELKGSDEGKRITTRETRHYQAKRHAAAIKSVLREIEI